MWVQVQAYHFVSWPGRSSFGTDSMACRPPRWQADGQRGEALAEVELLRQIEPVEGQWSTIYTDSAYFVRGAALPSQALLAGANGKIWLSWGQQARRHGGGV